jgi:hypothetical protein
MRARYIVLVTLVLLLTGCGAGSSFMYEGEGLIPQLLAPVVTRTLGAIPCPSRHEERDAERSVETECFISWNTDKLVCVPRHAVSVERTCGQ